MSIFQEKPSTQWYTDSMTLGGWTFLSEVLLTSERGNPLAIHGGRIIFLQISIVYEDDDESEVIAYFDEGAWYQTPDYAFEEGKLALEMIIDQYRR